MEDSPQNPNVSYNEADVVSENSLYDTAIAYAEQLGAEHGTSAATWVEIDNAAAILQGIEDGDPEIMDALPCADLSGEWADGLTPRQLVDDVLSEIDTDSKVDSETANDWSDGICDAYEFAFNTAAEFAVAEACRRYLA
jgi:hypothetical protein